MTTTRRAALSTLKANAQLRALVPAAQMHPQTGPANPIWPFIKFGVAQSIPIRASCIDGAQISFSVHAFAKSTAAVTAEDAAEAIGAAIYDAIDRLTVTITGGSIRFRISDQQLMPDGAEIGSFHYFAAINARVIV